MMKKQKNEYTKLMKNVGLITLGNFSSKLLVFFLIPIYTNVLTTSEYGIADLVFTTVSLLYPVFSILMTEAIMRFTLDHDLDKKQIFSIAFYLTIIGTIILFIVSPVILMFSNIKKYYLYFLCYYIIYVFNLLFCQFVKGLEQVNTYSIAGVLNSFLTIVFNIIFLLVFKLGIKGYFLAYIFGSLSSCLFLILKCKLWKYLISYKNINKNILREMIKYSIPMIPNSVSWWINNSSDKYLVSYFLNVSYTGIYSISYKIPSLLNILSNIFMSAWQISAVDDFGTEKSRLFYSDIYRKCASLNILVVSAISIFVKQIAKLIFAKDFFIAWQCSLVLLLGYLFNNSAAFLGTIYTSVKKTNYLFYSTLIGALLNIILNIILIPKFSILGAAIATLISYFAVFIYRLFHTRKFLKLDIELTNNFICYSLILIQILIHLLNIKFGILLNIIIFIIIAILNKKIFYTFIEILNKISRKLIHR